MSTITIGVDFAKCVFSVCEVDAAGHVLRQQDLHREAFALWLAQVRAGTVVAIEACSGAHHWSRRCLDYGLRPRLIAAQFVTSFRKSRTAKNDRDDAEAIATAAQQGNMRFSEVKSVDQQARLCWHRLSEGCKVESLAIGNRLRGLLAEFGIAVAKSGPALRAALADLDRETELPAEWKGLIDDLNDHWQQLRDRIDAVRHVQRHTHRHARRDKDDNTMTSESLGVQGKSVMQPLTGSLLANSQAATGWCSWRQPCTMRCTSKVSLMTPSGGYSLSC